MDSPVFADPATFVQLQPVVFDGDEDIFGEENPVGSDGSISARNTDNEMSNESEEEDFATMGRPAQNDNFSVRTLFEKETGIANPVETPLWIRDGMTVSKKRELRYRFL
uniref:Uncharacterized protein n=1 Tax=Caenorhabditis japonica TaxID=281687 RepID=A0A8R1II36_CAEJA